MGDPSQMDLVADQLRTARQTGRQVVILTGAGTSIDAGIPLGSHISDYLVRFATLVRRRHGLRLEDRPDDISYRSRLLETPWPSRHDLTLQLMVEANVPRLSKIMPDAERRVAREMFVAELRRLQPTVADAFKTAFTGTRIAGFDVDPTELSPAFAARIPSKVGYRAILSHLTENNQALIDACMDHFNRNREPTTAHQFLVFLGRELGTRLFLTTNFDPLLESALEQEHRRFNTYSIMGEATIPAGRLLASQPCSVLKLHGGAHNIEMSAALEDPMSPSAIARFMDIFHEIGRDRPPLILVLGYAGLDRRVMSMLAEHLTVASRALQVPAMIWVSRTGTLPAALEQINRAPVAAPDAIKPVTLSHYAEGRLFLQDLYLRITEGEFPVARSHYQAVAFVARTPTTEDVNERVEALLTDPDWSVAVVHGTERSGASSQVARMATALEENGRRRMIWIDLAEIRTISTMADVLSQQFGKVDARLCPFWRPVLLDSSLRVRLQPGDNVPAPPEHERILDLPRGCTDTVPDSYILKNNEAGIFIRALGHVLRRGEYLLVIDSLESFAVLHPALDGIKATTDAFVEEERRDLLAILRTVLSEASAGRLGDSRMLIAASPAGSCPDLKQFLAASEAYSRVKVIPLPKSDEREQLGYKGTKGLAMAVVAACRRPVPLNAVRSFLARDHAQSYEFAGFLQDEFTSRDAEVDDALKALTDAGDLSIAPGGAYWIHAKTRRDVYGRLRAEARWRLHEDLSWYYWNMIYLRSRDVRAFLEYLFHRTAALSERSRSSMNAREFEQWLTMAERACASLENEAEPLLARGRTPSLLFLMRLLWAIVFSAASEHVKGHLTGGTTGRAALGDNRRRLRRCAEIVCRVESELLMASGHAHSALDVQMCRLVLKQMEESKDWKDPASAVTDEVGDTRRIEKLEQLLETEPALASLDCKSALERADLYLGLADALQGSFEFGSQSKHGCPDDQWTTSGKFDRGRYLKLAERLFSRSKQLLQQIERPREPGRPRPRPKASARDVTDVAVAETVAKLTRRSAELTLVQLSSHRFLPRRARTANSRRGGRKRTNEQQKLLRALKTELADQLTAVRKMALTPRLRRHRCYLMTLQARVEFLRSMGRHTKHVRSHVRSLLRQAESHLARNAGAAERQALAVVRLTAAAFQVEVAEFEVLRAKHLYNKHGKTSARAEQLKADAAQDLTRAFLNLEEFEALIKEGRGELRWRFFHLLYAARMEMTRATLAFGDGEVKLGPRSPDEFRARLFAAGRHLSYAFTNSGQRTDRRPILRKWWDVLHEAMAMDPGIDRRQWRSRLGVEWTLDAPHPIYVEPSKDALLVISPLLAPPDSVRPDTRGEVVPILSRYSRRFSACGARVFTSGALILETPVTVISGDPAGTDDSGSCFRHRDTSGSEFRSLLKDGGVTRLFVCGSPHERIRATVLNGLSEPSDSRLKLVVLQDAVPSADRTNVAHAIATMRRAGAQVATSRDIIALRAMKLYDNVQRVNNDLRARNRPAEGRLQPSDLFEFDQYHYDGVRAVGHAARALGITSDMRVLEAGSGLGGPARYLASTTNCEVVALELQQDVHAAASGLTERCALSNRVRHVEGNLLDPPELARFDRIVSFLSFSHIPDRDRLFATCHKLLLEHGEMYIEDYVRLKTGSPEQEVALERMVACPYLPDGRTYDADLRRAGFSVIGVKDMAETWTTLTEARVRNLKENREEQEAIHGKQTVDNLREFFSTVADLFAARVVGGARIHVRRLN